MKNNNKASSKSLLQKAEELLLQHNDAVLPSSVAADKLKLIHELKVHQIELELQQQELLLANEAAAAAIDKYTSLYDFAPNGYFTILQNGSIAELNLCGSQMLGKERRFLIKKYFALYVDEASRLTFRFFLDSIFTSKIKQTCTVSITISNNLPLQLLLTGIVAQDETACLLTAADITDKIIAAAKINEEKGLSAAIVNNLPGIFYLYDEAGSFINWNRNFEIISGYSSNEIRNMRPIDFYDDAQQQIIRNRIKNVFDHQENQGIELKLLTKQGINIPFYINSKAIEYNGKTCLIGIGTDITHQKKIENALIESEQKFRMIAENTSDGMLVFDADNNIQYTSPAYLKQLGYSQAEEFSRNTDQIYHIIHPEDRDAIFAAIYYSIELKEPRLIYSYRAKHIQGHYIWREDNAQFKYDTKGNYAGANVVCRDITDRKLAEKETQDNNDFIKTIVNNIPAMVGYWTKDLYCTFSNSQYMNWFGRTEAEMQNISMIDLLGYDLFEKNKPYIKAVLEGHNQQFEKMTVKQDGKTAYTWAQFIPHKINGAAVGFFVLVTDITARKELEVLLNKTQNLARLGSWEVDLVKDTAYLSQVIKETFEVADDFESNLQTAVNFIKPGDNRNLVVKEIAESIATGKQWNADVELITAKGNEVWVRIFGEAEFKDGICVRIYGSLQDIDSQKRAENAIRISNERYNLVAKATNDSVWDWNIKTDEVFRIGEGFKTLFGYNIKEAKSDNQFWQKMVHPMDLSRLSASIYSTLNNPQEHYWEGEFRVKKANGNYADVYDKGFIIRDSKGKAIRMIGATQDITRLKENEHNLFDLNEELQLQTKELANSNKELEQFAYVASHDLQEPLRMVSSFLTLLEKQYADKLDENGKLYINYAVDGAKRMRQIILDLLELSRVGRTEGEQQQIDVNKLVNEIIVLHKKQVEEKDAIIEVGELPVIEGYKASLRQVFQNLIGNALKYSKKDTAVHITVSATELKQHWQFAIADNGIGIATEYFDKIFVLFQRLHKKEDFAGTGIGLAITKKVVESYGGKIWVTSKEGEGTTFYFTFKK
jgi:PAS domain S-box-containing protein